MTAFSTSSFFKMSLITEKDGEAVINPDVFDFAQSMFKASLIMRSYIVGLRYFRQPDSIKGAILNALLYDIKTRVFDISFYLDFSNQNLSSALTDLVTIAHPEWTDAEEWVSGVYGLASPALFSEYMGLDAYSVFTIWMGLCSFLKDNHDLEILRMACIGNIGMSNTLFFSGIFNSEDAAYISFNEDSLKDSKTVIPEWNTALTGWENVVKRRETQISQYYAEKTVVNEPNVVYDA